jgi:CRISPR-associated protein Cas2
MGEITASNIIKLRKELKKVINKKEDFVSIIKMMNEKSFEIESYGNEENEDKDFL